MTTTITARDLVEQEWVGVPEAARVLGVSEYSVRRWIREGELAALALGSRKEGYRIRMIDLDAFVAARYRGKRRASEPAQEMMIA